MKRKVTFINKGYLTNFQITMNNYSIIMENGKQIKSVLKSDFSREIFDIPINNVGFTRYILKSTKYMSVNDNVFKPWTFAKDTVFYSCLYCVRNKKVRESYYKKAKKEHPIPSLTESFIKFPKLPSVYLLVMQAMDVITLDGFLCMANSEFTSDQFSTKYMKVDEMDKRNIPIGMGIYSKSSYYLNGGLYIRLIGENIYWYEPCWIFEYSSEPSDVYMEGKRLNTALKSKSLYLGKMFVSKSTGDILYGELVEDILSMGKNKKYSKRVVVLEKKS